MPLLRYVFLLPFLATHLLAADVSLYDGKKLTGTLISVDDKELVIQGPSGKETIERAKVASVDFRPALESPANAKWIEVQLIDGTQFRCSEFVAKGNDIVLTLFNSGTPPVQVTVPLSSLFYMVRDMPDLKNAQRFRDILAKRGKRDIRLIQRAEILDGLTGTFGPGDPAAGDVSFEDESGQKRNVSMSRIFGMILNPPPVEVAQTLCRVVDINKNEIFVKAITLSEGKVVLSTITGTTITYPSMDQISKFDYSAGTLRYLSDIDPVKVEESSTDGPVEHYRKDRNLDGGELQIGNQKFSKGLAIHSRTVLTYDVGGRYRVFEAVIGVDNIVEGDSTVLLTIEADQKQVFKEKIQKKDPPRNLRLNIVGVKTIKIYVESEFLDLGNQVDLADAKFRK